MASIIPGYEYDIFISYRQKDNKGVHWVTEFISALKTELDVTFKEDLSIYYDNNPHDGLLETHSVDSSLEGKLNCLIFIPIISLTYCDIKSFAWQHELCAFNKLAKNDQFGRDIRLSSGNVASRILPIKIHNLDPEDKTLLENELGGALRAIEFIYNEPGVNRPLQSTDSKNENQNKTDYRNQINKTAIAVREIMIGLNSSLYPQRTESHFINGKLPAVHLPKLINYWFWLFPVLFIIGAMGIYFWKFNSNGKISPGGEKPSIVILPFTNLTNDPDQEYFSDGIADEIRTNLSSIKRLKVISRSSSMYFKGRNVTMKEIAQKLAVNHILTGTVQKLVDNIKITVELSDVQTDEVEWSLSTDLRPIKDIFNIQHEIGTEVAKQLRVNLNDQEIAKSFKQYTNDPKLYDAFLKAYKKVLSPDLSLKTAEPELNAIIKKDPDYTPAIKALAASYMIRGLFEMPLDSVRKKALPLFLKAQKLDKDDQVLPAPYGNYKMWYNWDFAGAEKIGLHGLEFNDEWSMNLLSEVYMKTGSLKEALNMALASKEINPLSDFVYFEPRCYLLSGNYQEAEKIMTEYLATNPPNPNPTYRDLGLVYIKQNRNQEAIDFLESTLKKVPYSAPLLTGLLAIAYYRTGQTGKFEAIMKVFKSQWEARAPGSPAFSIGMIYCNLGMTDEGFDWLEKSFKVKDIEMTWLKMEPLFGPVKNDPRYIDLLKRVGFS